MQETIDFVAVIQNIVIEPSWGSTIPLFFISFLNELLAVFPYVLVLAGQLVFLEGALDTAMLAKLLVFVAAPVGLGATLGVLPVYVLAYFGGKPLIRKYERQFHFSWEDVEKLRTRFRGHWYDELIFLALRCLPILPSLPLSVLAGVMRMNFAPYFVLTLVGFIIRMMLTIIMVGVGVESLSQLVLFIYTD